MTEAMLDELKCLIQTFVERSRRYRAASRGDEAAVWSEAAADLAEVLTIPEQRAAQSVGRE